MSDFEEYLTYQYYIDEEFLSVDAEIVNEDNVLTTVTLNPVNFDNVFEDFITEFYWFLYEFPGSEVGYVEVLNCPAGQNCEEFDAINEVADATANLDPITVEFLFDPSGDKSMEIDVNGKAFLQSLADEESYSPVVVSEAKMSMSMSESATITLPSNAKMVEDALEEAVMMSLVEELGRNIEQVTQDLYWNQLEDGLYTLEQYPNAWSFSNPAIDREMSTILISEGATLFTLYWRDGSMIFDAPISGEEMSNLIELNIYNPDFSRANLLAVIGVLDEANFSTGKAMVYLMMD
jgi:hypothetical protein